MHERAVKQSEAPNPTNQSRNKPIPSRHSLKCAVCNHPDRAAIEFDFLNWRNPGDLVKGYRFRGLSTIYRHAHATGLFAKRRLNLRFAMERIVERVNEVPVTATSVIRAARAIARINDSGEWIDPPSRVIVTHINRVEDCEAPSFGDAEASPAPRRRGTTKITAGSARSSLRARPAGQGPVPDIAAREHSAVSRAPVIFDKDLLDEPSESASAELPRIDGKPAPPEVILQLTPEFAKCREERRRALEADRAARAAHSVAPGDRGPTTREQDVAPFSSTLPEAVFDQLAPAPMAPSPARETRAAIEGQSVASPSSLLPQAAREEPARSAERIESRATDRDSLVGRGFNRDINADSSSSSLLPQATRQGTASAVPTPTPQEQQSVVSSSSLLPQAAFPDSASPALPHPAAIENNFADVKQSVAMPSSSLPPAAPDKPATAKQSPRPAGPPLGSSGSANPPFPFTPEPLRRWMPRRRF